MPVPGWRGFTASFIPCSHTPNPKCSRALSPEAKTCFFQVCSWRNKTVLFILTKDRPDCDLIPARAHPARPWPSIPPERQGGNSSRWERAEPAGSGAGAAARLLCMQGELPWRCRPGYCSPGTATIWKRQAGRAPARSSRIPAAPGQGQGQGWLVPKGPAPRPALPHSLRRVPAGLPGGRTARGWVWEQRFPPTRPQREPPLPHPPPKAQSDLNRSQRFLSRFWGDQWQMP